MEAWRADPMAIIDVHHVTFRCYALPCAEATPQSEFDCNRQSGMTIGRPRCTLTPYMLQRNNLAKAHTKAKAQPKATEQTKDVTNRYDIRTLTRKHSPAASGQTSDCTQAAKQLTERAEPKVDKQNSN